MLGDVGFVCKAGSGRVGIIDGVELSSCVVGMFVEDGVGTADDI